MEGLDKVADALDGAEFIAIDTESNSLHVYREQVCFVQICVGDDVFIIDTVAIRNLDSLRKPLSDPDSLKLLHGADYDVVCMKRDFDIGIEPIFDTMIAAQILGYEQLGLGSLAEKHCGVTLDKTLSRYDWGKRPLEDRYLPYLVEDVVHLETLYDILDHALSRADHLEAADIEFDRVALQEWSGRDAEVDPEGFRRIKGARDLDHKGLAVLKELYLLREELSEEANRPPFKVLGNAQLLDIAARRPHGPGDLRRIQGFPDRLLRRLGREITGCVDRGSRNYQDVPKRLPAPPRPPEVQLAINDGLRKWRRGIVQELEVPSLVVLPNHVVEKIAARRPKTLEELADVPGLGEKRLRLYGDAILRIVAKPPPIQRRRY